MNFLVRRGFWIAALWVAACSAWGCNHPGEKAGESAASIPAAEDMVVRTGAVERREWISRVPVSGSLRSLSVVEVKPEVGGRLTAVHCREGDLVEKGQLLAELDPANYRLAYDQAAATLGVAEAGLELARVTAEHAQTEKERADNLLRSGGITQKDHQAALTGVKEAVTQVRLAEAQCAQARAALAIARKALSDCEIKAPARGHVQKRFFDQGALLAPGVALVTLVDNGRLELECVVPSHQLSSLRPGQEAVFQTPTWGSREFRGVVAAINPAVESDSRSVKVILRISNPGGELRSGMYARGEITTGSAPDALVIARDALVPQEEDQDGAGVYVVEDGRARLRNIRIGGRQQDRVWVRSGLVEGELVIVEIGPALKEGAAVRTLP